MDPEAQRMVQALGQNQMPFLKSLTPGEWGTPAELYKGYKDGGLSKDDARSKILESLTAPTGSVEGGTPEEAQEQLLKQPMSNLQGLSPAALAALFLLPTPNDRGLVAQSNNDYKRWGRPEISRERFDARSVEPRGAFIGPGPLVGDLDVTYNNANKKLHVNNMDSMIFGTQKGDPTATVPGSAAPKGATPNLSANDRAFSLGPRDIRSGIAELQKYYPEMTKIDGLRISGSRELQRRADQEAMEKALRANPAAMVRMPERGPHAVINVRPKTQEPGYGAPGQRLTDLW